MEHLHLKQTDDRIERGIDGLKDQAMPCPPSRLIEKMIANPGPRHGRSTVKILALATCGGIAVTLLALVPQSSSAAVTLDRLVDSYKKSDVLYRVTPYWIEGKNRTPKIWVGYVKGDQWRYVQADYEQASDGQRIISYQPNDGTAQVWTLTANDSNVASVFASADLTWWKSSERKGLTLEHNVSWSGLRVDRYTVTTTSKDWGPTKNVLYADPVANRPIYAEYIHASGNGSAIKWDYLGPDDEGQLRIRMKLGTKVKDVTVLRRSTSQQKGGRGLPAKASSGR